MAVAILLIFWVAAAILRTYVLLFTYRNVSYSYIHISHVLRAHCKRERCSLHIALRAGVGGG